jgi:hypothetical protein
VGKLLPSETCVRRFRKSGVAVGVALALNASLMSGAQAFQFDTEDTDLKIVWDNTIKYNAAWRLKDPSAKLLSSINQDDGDRNFNKGLISNRINLLSEFDLTYRNFGARASGAAWYDTVYNHGNDNNSPRTANQVSVPYNEFTAATRKLHGDKAELLDAFAFAKFDWGESRASFRAGKHTLLWGESLFFGANGIAAGQAPVDIQKAQSVPNTPFKELIRPTGQVSGQVQINPDVSIGAYYQYRWERNRLPAVGSYFSSTDVVGDGGERLIAGAPISPTGLPLAFYRGDDVEAKNSGQGGLQVRFRLPDGENDYGIYLIRYHDKNPQLYLRPSGKPPVAAAGFLGTYSLVYPENVTAYGASISRTVGQINLASEVSVRRNTPLISTTRTVPPVPGFAADNEDNPLYAVGNSVHAQVSALWTLSPTPLFNEASFAGEIAWNRRTSITKNPQALDPNTTRDALGLRFSFEPTYRQVLPGLDVGVPLGLGYNPKGRSSVVSVFNNNGVDRGGDVSVGLNGSYLDAWRIALNFTHYFGSEGTFLDANNFKSFQQYLKDRDFISFTVRRTF